MKKIKNVTIILKVLLIVLILLILLWVTYAVIIYSDGKLDKIYNIYEIKIQGE